MTATATQINQVRRMTAERTKNNYSDEDIQAYIEKHPLTDPYGYSPDDPQELYDVNPDWTPTYDLNAAAADIWQEKASLNTEDFDFSADGASYSRSQKFQHAMQMARYYNARRSPKTITMQASPKTPLAPEDLDIDESN